MRYDYELCVSKLHYGFTPVSEREVCTVYASLNDKSTYRVVLCLGEILMSSKFILLTVKYTYGTRAKHTTKESLSRNTHHSSAVCTVWPATGCPSIFQPLLEHVIPK